MALYGKSGVVSSLRVCILQPEVCSLWGREGFGLVTPFDFLGGLLVSPRKF